MHIRCSTIVAVKGAWQDVYEGQAEVGKVTGYENHAQSFTAKKDIPRGGT